MTAKEKEIQKSMEVLGISRAEAEEVYQYDHEEIDNEEADKLTAKAEQNSKAKRKGTSLDKVRHMKAKKKQDANKQAIIDYVFGMVEKCDFIIAPKAMTGTRMTFKDVDGNFYSVTITKHKTAPDGYWKEG